MHKTTIVIVFIVILTGCGFLNSKADLNKEFSLQVGEEIEIEDKGLFIKFVSVTDDSRCYKSLYDWYISGHDCALAGEAKIVTVVRNEKETRNIEFWVVGNSNKSSIPKTPHHKKAFLNYQISVKNLFLNANKATFLVKKKIDLKEEPEEDDFSENKLRELEQIQLSVKICANECPSHKISYSQFANDEIELETKDSAYLSITRKFKLNKADKALLASKYEATFSPIKGEFTAGFLHKDFTKDQKCSNRNSKAFAEIKIAYKSKRVSAKHYLNCKNEKAVPQALIEFEKTLLEIAKLDRIIYKPIATKSKTAKFGEQFEISVDEEVQITNQNLSVRFISVLSDSRCPFHEGVVCSHRGEAQILLLVTKGRNRKEITLKDKNFAPPKSPGLRFESKSFLNYRIHLKDMPNKEKAPSGKGKMPVNKVTLMIFRN